MSIKIHKLSKSWNCEISKGWVGGRFEVSNLSRGYHGILKQWIDYYQKKSANCLLVSENSIVKDQFSLEYPDLKFSTLEYYEEMNQNVDLKYNLCEFWDHSIMEKYDIILCQATFEHLYDPCTAIKNLKNILNQEGILLIHTHVPGMVYHPFPKDYFRFYSDWFFEVENFCKGLKLIDLIEVDTNIFSAYMRDRD